MKDTEERTCENCRYFVQHFSDYDGRFFKVCCGHCANKNIPKRPYRQFALKINCKFWEAQQIQLEERQKKIREVIEDISRKLTEIEQIIKFDNE